MWQTVFGLWLIEPAQGGVYMNEGWMPVADCVRTVAVLACTRGCLEPGTGFGDDDDVCVCVCVCVCAYVCVYMCMCMCVCEHGVDVVHFSVTFDL